MPQANVIQGFFPGGLPRFADVPVAQRLVAQAGWVQEAIARAAKPAVAQGRSAQPSAPASRASIQPQATVRHTANGKAVQVPPQFATGLQSGIGAPLPAAVRQRMEASFGAGFADVRVHVGPQAASIGALACTRGTDVYFAPGHYDPWTSQGQRLLAHELSHVIQQRTGRVRNPFGSGLAVVQDAAMEAEAQRMAAKVVQPTGRVLQLGRTSLKRIKGKKKTHKRKLVVTLDSSGYYTIKGRPQFKTSAKKIKVSRVQGNLEDRRHIIPYHRLKAVIETAASLFAIKNGETALKERITELIKLAGSRVRTYDVKALVEVANSNPKNLFPENAFENQAIEKIRSLAKKAWSDLELLYKEGKEPTLSDLKKRAQSHFALVGSTPITFQMALIATQIHFQIEFSESPEQVFDAIKGAERSTELDINKKEGSKVQTEAALDLNNKMTLYLLNHSLEKSVTGEDGLNLIEAFFKLPSG
jgi:hypothetical protein